MMEVKTVTYNEVQDMFGCSAPTAQRHISKARKFNDLAPNSPITIQEFQNYRKRRKQDESRTN